MSPLDLIPAPYRFAAQIAGIVAIGIALMVGYVRLISYHEGIGYQQAAAICTADKLKAEQAANDRDAAYQSQIRKANHEAEQRQAALAADIADLHRQLERVRHDRNAMRARVADLSAEAARRVAGVCLDVHDECTERYSALAETADRLAADCRTLNDAWPR